MVDIIQPSGMMIVAALLGGASFAIVVYMLVTPYLSGEKQVKSRIQSAVESRSSTGPRRTQADQLATRKRAVTETLKDLESKQKASAKQSLRVRLERAGISATPRTFWIVSFAVGMLVTVAAYAALPSAPLPLYGVVLFAAMFGLPRLYLASATKKRQKRFVDEFADALDVIVRGVKSGLPFNECLGVIARETPEPVRGLFREVIEQQRVGVTLSDCMDRAVERMPVPELKFFTIVVNIQQQAGGNLSEALGNLSTVIRARKQMQAKVQALSAEAKASAYVLGSMPFAVGTMLYLSSRDYIMVLFETKTGQFMLLCSAVWMTLGILMMRKMINFKF
ncbi:MAG: type II secretion system F family protein [Hyphomicrobiaceae bacterium]